MTQDKAEQALEFDALSTAEKITGESYKEDESTSMLGLLLNFQHNKKKDKILQDKHDTVYSMQREDYIDVVEDIGFEQLLHDRFEGKEGDEEHLYIYWDYDRGIFLYFETYSGITHDSVNSAGFTYNWIPDDDSDWYGATSSGTMTDGCWIGHHDGREGLRTKIERLEKYGDFVAPWIEPDSMTVPIGHSEDRKGEVLVDRFKRLPNDVIQHMGDLSNILYLEEEHVEEIMEGE